MPVCSRCHGSGWQGALNHFDHNRVPCIQCGGSGVVSEPGGGFAGAIPIKAIVLVVIGGLAYLGYRYGVETSNMPGSSRGTFFAMVGGYLGFLLIVWRKSGIFGVAILVAMFEAISRVAFGFSVHQYILNVI